MKKWILFYLLFPVQGEAGIDPRILHCTLCSTAAINLACHLNIQAKKRHLYAQSEQLRAHLFLPSDEAQTQRSNLIYQFKGVEVERNYLTLQSTLSTIGLALHIFYAGYFLKSRLLQSRPNPE